MRNRLALDIVYLCTKLDDPSFRCSRDMIGDSKNSNSSCDLATSLIGIVCHLWASTCYLLSTIFKVSNSIHYKGMKGDTKCGK